MLFSSFGKLPEEDFEGFLFDGPDLVIGRPGLEVYLEGHPSPFTYPKDGCYTACTESSSGTWLISVDAQGLRKLFVYESGANWAVADSFSELISHLRDAGVRVYPNFPQLAALSASLNATDQLSSHCTPARDVRLLPLGEQLEISGAQLRSVSVPRVQRAEIDYSGGLRRFLATWLSRAGTVVCSDTQFTVDVSGGRDSRTVVSLILAAQSIFGRRAETFYVSNKGRSTDYEVAQLLAKSGNFDLGGAPGNSNFLMPDESVGEWVKHSLGVYTPVYFPLTTLNANAIHAHGGGGGTLRPLGSEPKTLDQLLASWGTQVPGPYTREWQLDVEGSFDAGFVGKRDARYAMFANYRNRFHFGRRPHNEVLFMPLNSTTLNFVPRHHRQFRDAQIYYDIISNTMPEFMDIPYDEPMKNPTKQNLEDMVVVHLNELELESGRVYSAPSVHHGRDAKRGSGRQAAKEAAESLWITRSKEPLQSSTVQAMVGPKTFALASGAITYAEDRGRPPHGHSPEMKALSSMWAAAFILDPDSLPPTP